MTITLKRIKYDKYDMLKDIIDVTNFFNRDENPVIQEINNSTEDILIDGNIVTLDINPQEYIDIIDNNESKGESSKLIAKKLYEDFKINGEMIPLCYMYEKELWTYLNLTVFFDVVNKKYFYDEDSDNQKKKIERYYFNADSKVDRTGLRYLWVLASLTYFDNSFELTNIAWDFTDPFKALHESAVGKNPIVLKAFAMAIKKLGYNSKIRNSVNRTLIPLHLRSYACPNMVDSYADVSELADIFATQIKIVLDNPKLQEEVKQKKKIRKGLKKKRRNNY